MEEASLHTTRKHTDAFLIKTYDKHGVLPRKACLRSLCLTRHLNLLDIGECLEIRDYQLCEWSTPTGLKLARENLQSRVKEEDSITDVENAVFDLGVVDSLCFLFVELLKELNHIKHLALESFLAKIYLRAEIDPNTHLKMFLHECAPKTAPKANSLDSHISSNGSFQYGDNQDWKRRLLGVRELLAITSILARSVLNSDLRILCPKNNALLNHEWLCSQFELFGFDVVFENNPEKHRENKVLRSRKSLEPSGP
ncbi:hypothetical protein Tco_0969588 [Tanacetum coccineum]